MITGLIKANKSKSQNGLKSYELIGRAIFFTPVWGMQSCKKTFLFLIAQALLWMQKEKKSAIQQLIQGVSKSAPW